MEQARWAVGVNAWTLRGGSEGADVDISSPVNLAPIRPVIDMPAQLADERDEPKREWAATLDLVQEACSAMRGNELRIEQLEAEAERHRSETRSEMEALQAQLRLAQREIERAYEQTATAMARATAAEAWLDKLNEAIVTGFGRTSSLPQRRHA